jgi:hypothetical protein
MFNFENSSSFNSNENNPIQDTSTVKNNANSSNNPNQFKFQEGEHFYYDPNFVGSKEEYKILLEQDIQSIITHIESMSQEDFDNLLKEPSLVEKMFGFHLADSQYVATQNTIDLLKSHQNASRIGTLLGAIFSMGTASAACTFSNDPRVAKGVGLLVSGGIYSMLQYVAKEKILEHSKYEEGRLDNDYKFDPKTNKIKENKVQDFVSRKRLMTSLGLTIGTALLAGAMTMADLHINETKELEIQKVEQIQNGINKDFERDQTIRAKIMELQKQISQTTDKEQLAKLNKELSIATSKHPVFAFVGEQEALDTDKERCNSVLTSVSTNEAVRNTADYQGCVVFNKGQWNGSNKPSGVSGYETKQDELAQKVALSGGEYKQGEPPITPAMKQKSLFESVKSSDPKATLTDYYTKLGKPEEAQKFIAMVEGGEFGGKIYPKGYYYSEIMSPSERALAGLEKVKREIHEGAIPSNIVVAMLVLIVESISAITTINLLASRDYRKIFINQNIQEFGQQYNLQMVKSVTEYVLRQSKHKFQTVVPDSNNPENTTIKTVSPDFIPKLQRLILQNSQHSNLAGQTRIINQHLTQRGDKMRTGFELDRVQNAQASIQANMNANKIILSGVDQYTKIYETQAQRDQRHQGNIARFGAKQGNKMNKLQDQELFQKDKEAKV